MYNRGGGNPAAQNIAAIMITLLTKRIELKVVTAGKHFRRTFHFDGPAANYIVMGPGARAADGPDLSSGCPCIHRTDLGFVLTAPTGTEAQVNGKSASEAFSLHHEDHIRIGDVTFEFREVLIPALVGKGREEPRERGIAAVYEAVKKAAARLGIGGKHLTK